mmetsp:Transcript_36004/g.93661  ORF Transcript_36004/g.93661 Transcript_36004/m.93661 type:complete len:353 (-) Transcript_36004:116-1174(-)
MEGSVRNSELLFSFSELGDEEAVRDLLKRGADVTTAPMGGYWPILSAARKGHLGVVAALLEHGASPNVTGFHRITPLHFAAANGDLEMVELLMKHGANPNANTNRGYTPLKIVCSWRQAVPDSVALTICSRRRQCNGAVSLLDTTVILVKMAKALQPGNIEPTLPTLLHLCSNTSLNGEAQVALFNALIRGFEALPPPAMNELAIMAMTLNQQKLARSIICNAGSSLTCFFAENARQKEERDGSSFVQRSLKEARQPRLYDFDGFKAGLKYWCSLRHLHFLLGLHRRVGAHSLVRLLPGEIALKICRVERELFVAGFEGEEGGEGGKAGEAQEVATSIQTAAQLFFTQLRRL